MYHVIMEQNDILNWFIKKKKLFLAITKGKRFHRDI